ncbi:MAG: hypothetical protein IKS22_03580 [Bacteroidales bacterium]|nr:hypothetical protein [Bacteroidales bacterium]
MKKILPIAAAAAFLTLSGAKAEAQSDGLDYFLPDTCNYNPAIPTPASVLGFELGELMVSPEKGAEYIKEVVAASDRMSLIRYGWTNERRPLYLVVVSSPENIRNMDSIKEEHSKLSDPSANGSTDGPIFTWLGHSIHGNETSGYNASLLLVYHLAAARTAHMDEILRSNVILIDPMINPDGIGRFTEWANSHRSYVENPDNQELEHIEAWPGGRFNHYWFDLNRDWINQTQIESRYRAEAMHDWKPNIYICAHEQGSEANYHFSPGEPTRVHPLIPDECQEFIRRLAKDYYAPAFDDQGMMYFSGEVYDDYYPGRGREYLDFYGGIALLWEEQSSRGFLRNTVNGLLSFPLSVHNQLVAELATLRGATDMREELLSYQKKFYRETSKEGSGYYVFGSSNDLASAFKLAETVKRNGVEIYALGKDLTVGGKKFVKDSAFAVPVRQARHRMVEALFEIREEYADSLSYDITGWTMPMAFNLDYAHVPAASLGDEFDYNVIPKGKIERASYAYAFEWGGFYAPRALYRLLSRGVFAKVSQEGFSFGEKVFGRGSVIVPLGKAYQCLSEDEIFALMETISEEDMIDIYAINSGFTGGHNLGSATFSTARLPKVAVIGSTGATAVPVGDLWNLFDNQYGIPLSIIPTESFPSIDLSRYNVLFVTAAHGSMDASSANLIRQWVQQGGTLVTLEQGLRFLPKLGLDPLGTVSPKRSTDISYGDIATSVRAQGIPGVILDSRIDITHPLGWGYTDGELPVFKNNAIILKPLENALRTPVRHPGSVLLSGNLLPSMQELLAETPVCVVTGLGSGRIISYTVDPNFRGIWYGTSKLTANAVFFGEMISSYSL